ncbi:long-chain fatty acid--CoA ligase [Pradoshia eiseniae]|uniref:Long-chain fatty acid--CoA ligase n=1 Tax=Pradoshia eiseniae TaxID=2064768 RepID=A0A2S7MZK0_9BACI|nr:long-chain fatty acid--CoA ligase [Pradoshia eiseniae]PQD95158.1 long-chain fatty acid--CoA ligase [Pradoshia eiseniae]
MENTKGRAWHQWYVQNEIHEVPNLALYDLLEKSARQYPEQPCIIFEDKEWSYETVKQQADKLAGGLQSLGLAKGDRIGLMLENDPLYIISYYAAQRLGLIVVQINPRYTVRELLQIAADSSCRAIIYDKTASHVVNEAQLIYPFEHLLSTYTTEDSKMAKTIDDLMQHGIPPQNIETINPREDVAVIQYTGGTTGKMKGAMLTHRNVVANVVQSREMYGDIMVEGQEIVLTATPLYHVYAMTSGMNLSVYLGSAILLYKRFEPKAILEGIERHKPTFFPGVPKMYMALTQYSEIDRYDLTSLKMCTSGSAPIPIEILNRFERLTGASIGEGFGLSEASPTTHRNPPNGIRKVGSVGIPVPGTDCMIVDDNNQPLAENQVGELLIRGPQVMKGYWNNELETARALRGGWLYTGDLAMQDRDGYFYIVGRKKEMVIVGGFNIYPQEVEDVLYGHPDIKEAAVAGIPAADSEEIVKAFIVPKEGITIDLEEVKGYCYSRLTPYKVPSAFEIRNELPRNTVGKLLKRTLIKEELDKRQGKE